MKIVVVDDNALDRLLAKILINKYYPEDDLLLFDNPYSAFDYLTSNPFDILISDYEMPGITGLDLIRQLFGFRDDLLIHHKLFLYSSDTNILGQIKSQFKNRISGIIDKPLTKNKLTTIIQNAWKN